MDYISKRKNNIQSISIYCRPHQGLREEKPFCELPPLPLHPFSYQQRHGVTAAPRTGEPCWSSSDPCLIQREAFPLNQSLIPATLKQDTMNPAIHQPLLQALSSRTRRPIYGASKGIHYSETCCPSAGVSLLLCQRQHRAVAALTLPRPLTNLKTDDSSLPA